MTRSPRFRMSQILAAIAMISCVLAVVLMYGRQALLSRKVAQLTSKLDFYEKPDYSGIDFFAANELVDENIQNQPWLLSLQNSKWESQPRAGKPFVLEVNKKVPGQPIFESKIKHDGFNLQVDLVFDVASGLIGIKNPARFTGGKWTDDIGQGARLGEDLMYFHLDSLGHTARVDTVLKRIVPNP